MTIETMKNYYEYFKSICVCVHNLIVGEFSNDFSDDFNI